MDQRMPKRRFGLLLTADRGYLKYAIVNLHALGTQRRTQSAVGYNQHNRSMQGAIADGESD